MKNITFLCGYYGSGKSELAINLAIKEKVDYVVDLDVINPYFRTREQEKKFKENGIEVISSDLDYKMHIDMPYISSRVYIPFHNNSKRAIYDLGGNDVGAKLLRQFEDYSDKDIDLYLVINVYREETSDEEKILTLINKIEGIGGFKVTGLINNSNLLRDTTLEDISYGEEIIKKVSEKSHLPIVYTAVWENIYADNLVFQGEILKLKLYFRMNWL
jgi:MinD-like ATPase involved in chromosome partitioning or flagellar assembly